MLRQNGLELAGTEVMHPNRECVYADLSNLFVRSECDGLRASTPFLDFETVSLAVPVWQACHPYDAVPVQFSCHVQGPDGRVTHHEWLAEGSGDPRSEVAA